MSDEQTKVENLPTFEAFEEDSLLTLDDVKAEEKEEEKPEEKSDEEKPEEKPEEKAEEKKEETEEEKKEEPEDKVHKETDKPEEEKKEEAPVEDEGTIWDDVNKITGSELEVDFGDVDPETPEGAAIWEAAVRKDQSEQTFDWLKTNFPKVARALDYEMNGGSIDDLYVPGEPDFSEVEIKDDDVDRQKGFLADFYRWKGISDARAAKMIEIAEDEGALAADAKSALQERQKEQKGRLEKAQQEAQQREAKLKQADDALAGNINSMVTKGHLNNFTIPQKERKEVDAYIRQHLQRDGQGGHFIVMPVDPAKLGDQMQMLYFGFKGGDLSGIIDRGSVTSTARKFKRAAAKIDKETGESGSDELKSASEKKKKKGSDLPTMEDHTVE